MVGGKHNFRWPPCKLMSSRGLSGPGLCHFTLVHSVSRSPIWLYTCSLVFKPPTPVSMYCQHQPCYFGERTEAFRRGHRWVPSHPPTCSHTWLDPHPLPSVPSALRSNLSSCVWSQLSLWQSQGHYPAVPTFGEAATVLGWYHQGVPFNLLRRIF